MIGMTENQLRLIERFGVSIQNHVVVGDVMSRYDKIIVAMILGMLTGFAYAGLIIIIL